uniref:Uncharacterized protein n=1 Tax=Physcomitrium patens TaxID=3218 RepID=A0A7I4DJX8_PHYPA
MSEVQFAWTRAAICAEVGIGRELWWFGTAWFGTPIALLYRQSLVKVGRIHCLMLLGF